MKRIAGLTMSLISVFTLFAQEQSKGLDERINEWFTPISNAWAGFVFTSVEITDGVSVPLVIVLLLFAGLAFTVIFKLVNIRHC